MGTRDKRIDAYIAKSQPFAKPILTRIRETVHQACPGVTETIKWGMPAFDYKGPMCGMAAFKQHATFGFWKSSLVFEDGDEYAIDPNGMAAFGKMTSLSDLPPRNVLARYIRKAAALNDDGVKAVRQRRRREPLPVPPALAAALKKNRKAKAAFDAFPPSHQREYNEWIGEAKTEPTRDKRVAQAIEWIAEGKSRNWKYART
ncbi:MAG TPA: YdeI/OmpD-associated family protein [Vicinamibacterales bacterium]|nr:YdeI/OmpD-associated family protein [Vicinamibacterales bacterium]